MTPIRVELQRDGIDDILRKKLWTALQLAVFEQRDMTWRYAGVEPDLLARRLWIYFFNEPVDTAPSFAFGAFREVVRQWFFDARWYEIYDFLEAILAELEGDLERDLLRMANNFLEQEMSAYRIVGGRISEITDTEEIQSIEEALAATGSLAGVKTHLRDALAKATDRSQPDFRNSIKESISAVEAMCQLICGDPKASLGQAIKRLKDSDVQLHPSLEQAWLKLYGYTSNASGIRHALSDQPNVTFADAKYMLVSCSAFVNHLLELSRLAGVPLPE